MTVFLRLLFSLLVTVLLFSCTNDSHDKKEIEAAMAHYDHLVEKMNADSIALMYTPDGQLGSVATGRDSIRNFLAAIKNVIVTDQHSVTDSIRIINDTAFQTGSYIQTAILSAKDTIRVKGRFDTRWEWTAQQGWLVKEMAATPVK